jgi:hypothetical protein
VSLTGREEKAVENSGPDGSTFDGVFFTEASSPQPVIRRVAVEISRQNSNLTEVKTRMAEQARSAGANAITNFVYGQRAHKWWRQAFSFKWDSESWFGEGDAVQL